MITKNYIKMCEQAKEIQDKWRNPFRNKFGDTYWRGKKYLQISEACVLNIVSHLKVENEIWLPTQEQLQEMILNHGHQGYDNSGISTMLFLFSMDYKLEDLTFTELWLNYVMKEKYNKIWTGEKWVIAKSRGIYKKEGVILCRKIKQYTRQAREEEI